MPNTHSYNPDVLTCLANLSADEVFTPPKLANQVLDILPAALWSDASATFLDPVCKSGVFLREIAKRLNKGLAGAISDTQTRLNHIFTRQLFEVAFIESMIRPMDIATPQSADEAVRDGNEGEGEGEDAGEGAI